MELYRAEQTRPNAHDQKNQLVPPHPIARTFGDGPTAETENLAKTGICSALLLIQGPGHRACLSTECHSGRGSHLLAFSSGNNNSIANPKSAAAVEAVQSVPAGY